jgi:hypothetical protein
MIQRRRALLTVRVEPGDRSASAIQWPESIARTAPERLRWIADYLDLADKAISVIACVQGVDYPPDCRRGAQQDLRRWARWLEVRPALAAGFAVARVVPEPEDVMANGKTKVASPTETGSAPVASAPTDVDPVRRFG